MGEKKRSLKIMQEEAEGDGEAAAGAAPSADEADLSALHMASASKKLRQQQVQQQQLKQKKITEANRALKREKRKQRVKKAKSPRTVSAAALSKTSPEYAIEYVKQWKERKEQWKFQTLVQAWLLHNLLDHTKVSREDFPLVMEYAATVKGGARQRLDDQLRALVEARDRWPSLREEGMTDDQVQNTLGREKPSKKAYGRARKLLQLLDNDAE